MSPRAEPKPGCGDNPVQQTCRRESTSGLSLAKNPLSSPAARLDERSVGSKRRAGVWEASLGAVLHRAPPPRLGLLEVAPLAQKPSRSWKLLPDGAQWSYGEHNADGSCSAMGWGAITACTRMPGADGLPRTVQQQM